MLSWVKKNTNPIEVAGTQSAPTFNFDALAMGNWAIKKHEVVTSANEKAESSKKSK